MPNIEILEQQIKELQKQFDNHVISFSTLQNEIQNKTINYICGCNGIGVGICDEREYKKDCYNYQEIQDMGAHIPTCKLEHELGMCPCKGCAKFVSKEEIRSIVNEYLRTKYANIVKGNE